MPAKAPLLEKFWRRVKLYDCHEDDCWEWTGPFGKSPKNTQGQYGRMSPGRELKGKLSTMAHRISYFLFRGPIPDGMSVLHTCDWTACVNPKHLFLGTNKDNYLDMRLKGRENKAKGVRHGMSKLTPEKVVAIRKRCSEGITQENVAKEFNVSDSAVGFIMTGRTWRHVK